MKNFNPVIIGAAVFGFALAQPALSLDTFDNPLLHLQNRFDIASGEVLAIADDKSDKPYRVCVRNSWHMVPLNVIHDGMTTTVDEGRCANFEAKSISISPAKQLANNEVLSGQLRHIHE